MTTHAAQGVAIAPSILAANFARLGDQALEALAGGADRLHLDVMDGHFVPNITFGPPVVRALRKVTSARLETHLMIETPERYLEAFVEAGSDSLIVHVEGAVHLDRTVAQIRALGARAGVALNPATSETLIEEIVTEVDLVLVMTVNPGFGGQAFIPRTLGKLERVRELVDRLNPRCEVEVDGGIDPVTAPRVVAAGANVLVAGSAVFGVPQGIVRAIAGLREAALHPGTKG